MNRIEIDSERLRTSCWVSGPESGTPVLLIHGNPMFDLAERVADLMKETLGAGLVT